MVINPEIDYSKDKCLLCNYPPVEEKDEHIPWIVEPQSGVYVCKDCVYRCRTVSSFGLTVPELKQAAEQFKRNKKN